MNPPQIAELKRLCESAESIEIEINGGEDWVSYDPDNILILIARLESLEAKLETAIEALKFYEQGKHFSVDHKSNAFLSTDFDEFNFHGKLAREALAKLKDGED